MPIIQIETLVEADIQIVFDLSRSIDLHQMSAAQTNEVAIAGVTSGLINKGEWVTWKAKHFGVYQQLTARITEMKSPTYFVDEMVTGAFKRFKHGHIFTEEGSHTLMVDVFDYTSPFGVLGILADQLFLKSYMTRFLSKRNDVIKRVAESEAWKEVLVRKSYSSN